MVLDNYLQVSFLLFHRQLAVVQSPEFLKLEQAGAAVVVSGATVVVTGATVVVVVVVSGAKWAKYDGVSQVSLNLDSKHTYADND